MNDSTRSEETVDLNEPMSCLCSCGSTVVLRPHGTECCADCGQTIALLGPDEDKTLSVHADLDSGGAFELREGMDRSGQELGHFRLLEQLGYGGMGEVYRALDQSLQRLVAVKVIRSTVDVDSHSVREISQLLGEAVAQARMNHPNVVTVYYVGRDGEEPFLAMELLSGPTLAKHVKKQPLAYKDLLRYARQITDALKHASQLGLVHGDIKPSNLILANSETVKLGDFGLAKNKKDIQAPGISGTLNYMAPELTRGVEASDQSDMYALGVTLFELTFGRRPYSVTGTTLKEQIRNQHEVEAEFPEKWPNSIPVPWKNVLQRLLDKSPENRYEDYSELAKTLKALSPVGFTNAGLLNRGLAVAIDYSILMLGITLFLIPVQMAVHTAIIQAIGVNNFPPALREFTVRFGRLGLMAPLVPAIATWMQWRGWRTPGRYLFQLRVVDAHGLKLEWQIRVLRSIARNIPIWLNAITVAILAVFWDQLQYLRSPLYVLIFLVGPLNAIIFLVNLLPALSPRRKALHDHVFGSHVVLDTKGREG